MVDRNKIKEFFKAIYIYRYISRGWTVTKTNKNVFEATKPSAESKTIYENVKLSQKN